MKKNTMKVIILFYLIFIFNFGINAQTINLEQARALALANSRSLAKYEMSIRSSILDEKNQFYSMLPSVSASYSASVNYLQNWEFVNPIDTFSTGATVTISQIIFQGGKGFIQKAIQAIATESVRKDALAEYFNVLDSIDNAYYAVLETAAALEAEEASLEAALLSYSIAEVRHSTGIINPGDYLKALSDREGRENSRNQARRNLALNMSKFKSLTGISGNVELETLDFSAYDGVLRRLSAITDEEADALYATFWKMMETSNPSLARAALGNQRAQKSYLLTWSDFSPVLTASIFSGGLNFSTERGFSSAGAGGVSIRGTIPLDFWVILNRIEKSKIARDSAVYDYVSAEINIAADLQSALLNAYAQAASVLSSQRSLEYTERHFEFVMERYRLSLGSVSDLSDATSLLINSRYSGIRSRYSFLQSLSRLRSMCALDDEQKLMNVLMGL
ncbi:MAG: TolC family protein [Treponema sp.]|nr:TolC family protein [Treponema sp.]